MIKTISGRNEDRIYPCPISKGYGISKDQAWLSLKIFVLYHIVIASLFTWIAVNQPFPTLLGESNPKLFRWCSLIFLGISLLSCISWFYQKPSYAIQAQMLLFTDIVILVLCMHASGGILSGLGLLLIISVAAGGLMIGGQCALLFSALASLAIIAEQFYAFQTKGFEATAFTYAGLLGACYFAIAILSYILARRAEQTHQTVIKLEELNQYIVQHLPSGIIIFDRLQHIIAVNEAAKNLLHLDHTPATLSNIAKSWSDTFASWLIDPFAAMTMTDRISNNHFQTRLTQLSTSQETFFMYILEDSALYNQRLQQGKLASLGRLTASIAHEIRNPIGAISHASQLLNENPALELQDQRLIEIILTHTGRVNQIIEDILQLSRRNISKREQINLSEWLQDYLHKFIKDYDVRSEYFSLESDSKEVIVLMTPAHLKQILDNLVTNALKYAESKSPVIKLVLHYKTTQKLPYLDVIDNGKGIAPEHVAQLFEPFFTTSASGTGLGLYISKELAELNQANLIYLPDEQDHSRFRLYFQEANNTVVEL